MVKVPKKNSALSKILMIKRSFLTDESRILRLVKSNGILICASNGLKLEVISVETKNQSEIVLHVSGEDVTLRVHSIYTRSIEDDIVTTVLNNINQSSVI